MGCKGERRLHKMNRGHSGRLEFSYHPSPDNLRTRQIPWQPDMMVRTGRAQSLMEAQLPISSETGYNLNFLHSLLYTRFTA